MNGHKLIVGDSGSGKSTTVRYLLSKSDVPFLVIDPTYEYRSCRGNYYFSGLKVFSIGKDFAPIYFNPLYIQKGIGLDQHISNIMTLFEATLMITGPVVNILRKGLYEAYYAKGWNRYTGQHPALQTSNAYCQVEHKYYFPIMSDILPIIRQLVNKSNYQGEIKANIHAVIENRIADLCDGAKGRVFNTYEFYGIEELLSQRVIIEPYLKGNDQAFVMSLIILLLNEYLSYHRNPSITGEELESPKHILVIEEAHNLFNLSSNLPMPEGAGNAMRQLTQDLETFLRESRKYGESVYIIDQDPASLPQAVIQNTDTKLIHHLNPGCNGYDLMNKVLFFDHDPDTIRNKRERIQKLKLGKYYYVTNGGYELEKTPDPKGWFKKQITKDLDLKQLDTGTEVFDAPMQYLHSLDNLYQQRLIAQKFLVSICLFPEEELPNVAKNAMIELQAAITNPYLELSDDILSRYLSVLTCECIVWSHYKLFNRFLVNLHYFLSTLDDIKAIRPVKMGLHNTNSLYEKDKTIIQYCAERLAVYAQRDRLSATQILIEKSYYIHGNTAMLEIANEIEKMI